MSEPVKNFPLGRLDEIRQRPADFRLEERVPLTAAGVMDHLPIRLNDPIPGERTHQAVFLDTETTGRDKGSDRIIELGMVKVTYAFDRRLILSVDRCYDEFEDPGRPIPREITELTGITDAMVSGHKFNQEEVVTVLNGRPLVIAHNAGFDRPFFEKRFAMLDSLSWACTCEGISWNNFGSKYTKLEYLLLSRGWFYEAHRAYMDCLALLWLMYTEPGAFRMLIDNALKSTYRVMAFKAPIGIKDELKRRGYKWKKDGRAVWSRECGSREEAEKYLGELHVLYSEAGQARIEECNAATRFKSSAG